MFEICKGMIVKSLTGHDKETLYIVVNRSGDWIYVSDGRLKLVSKPKKKKIKHVQPIAYIDKTISEGKMLDNKLVRNAINRYSGK